MPEWPRLATAARDKKCRLGQFRVTATRSFKLCPFNGATRERIQKISQECTVLEKINFHFIYFHLFGFSTSNTNTNSYKNKLNSQLPSRLKKNSY